MIKVGIDGRAASWYRGTGIGTYSYQLLNSLNNNDKTNSYLVFLPSENKLDFSFNNNFIGTQIYQSRKNNFWDEVNIPVILKNTDVQLYHVPQNGVGLPEEKNCRFVITLHDVIPCRMPETVSEKYLNIFSNVMPEILSKCDAIITVSNYSKNDIASQFHFPKDKIYVTYLAGESIYHPISREFCKAFIKQKYKMEDDFILYVGGFSPRKNIISLINAFSQLQCEYKKKISLIIAGHKGNSFEIYKKRTEELHVEKSVIFPGFIPKEELPYFYNAAETFVYPSFYEGFGLPPIEAMSCGTPVIASNVTSMPEVLQDAAILIAPSDVDELCRAMICVLNDNDLKRTLKLKGLNRASSLSWDKTALKTMEIYKKIIEAKN
jgi:glycosyltransferase involved in cell wall biosynthesis